MTVLPTARPDLYTDHYFAGDGVHLAVGETVILLALPHRLY